MARGVSENFLSIARREQRLGLRAAVAAALLAGPAAFLAELADAPGYGPTWMLFVGALVLGLLAGLAFARWRLARYEDALRLRWNHWMRGAVDAARLGEVAHRAEGRDTLPPWLPGAAFVLLLGANVALFALLWVAHPLGQALAAPLVAADGLLLGALVTTSAMVVRWARDFVRTAEEMVRRGELTLWGER